MPKIITFFTHAGGAGKSSVCRELGYILGSRGVRVLLVDLDPQANLTAWLGVRGVPLQRTVHDTAVEDAPLPEPYRVHGVDLIASTIGLSVAEARMLGITGSQMHLRNHLREYHDRYDIVLIDSPPSLGQLSVLGAIAADHLIVPVPTREKGINGIEGVLGAVRSYRKLNPNLTVALYVPTMFDRRNAHDKAALQVIQNMLKPLGTPIQYRPAVWNDSTSAGQPVAVYAPGSEAHQQMERLADEVAAAVGLPLAVRHG